MKLYNKPFLLFFLILQLPMAVAAQFKGASSVPALSVPPPSAVKAQADLFAYLKKKSGREVALPSYPANGILKWALNSYTTAGSNAKLLYPTIYGQLLVAQKLLSSKDSQQQRRGLRVAHNANFKAAIRLKDKRLCAQIFDALILPNIAAASTGKGTLSRARLLQDGASAYRLTGQRDKQVGALQLLVAVTEKDKDTDGADWARVKLADVLAAQGNYQEAADLLKAVTSANMSGSKRRIATLEAKAAQKKPQTSELTSQKKQ